MVASVGACGAGATGVSAAAGDGAALSGDGTGTDVVDAGEAGTVAAFAIGGAFFGVVGNTTLGGIGSKSLLLSQDIV